MLVIRQEQINTLIMGDDERFVESLIKQAKRENPEIESKYNDETLREMVRGGINRAKSHNLKNADDITGFVSTMFKVAPNFDEQPEIKAILEDEKTPPDERFEKIRSNLVSEEAWKEAKNNYDEKAWFSDQEKEDNKPPAVKKIKSNH